MKRTLDNGRRRQIVSPAPPAAERLERRVLLANDGAAQLVLDIEPATEGSFDSGGMILRVGDSVYLTGEDADSPVNNIVGRELWRSDGQSTTLVKDIAPGQLGSNPENFTAFNGTLFFTVERTGPTTSVAAIWKSDGTAAGTVRVSGFPTYNFIPQGLQGTTTPGRLFFAADDGVHGSELWKTDGTRAGTRLVADVRAGAVGSDPRAFKVVGGVLYFTADDLVHGRELWRTDGTAAGTYMVDDINPIRV